MAPDDPASDGPVPGSTLTTATRLARGVVPHQPQDPVLKAPYAHGGILFATLRPGLDIPSLEAWLTKIEAQIQTLRGSLNKEGNRVATVAVGFAPSFFIVPDTGTPRFPEVLPPAGFTVLPSMPLGSPVSADVAFYLVATAEAELARFITGVASTAPDVLTLEFEQGYKSFPDREAFGYADGLRNAQQSRNDVVFVDADRQAEEPQWATGGTYMSFMRIAQNVDAFSQLLANEQDSVIGRDRVGRRLDQPEGSSLADEGDFTGDIPPVNSHVRKVGPRGSHGRDGTQIFRRGLPFYEVKDGRVVQGLQFVSFQASLDQFDAVYGRWMLNQDFPHQGAGQDALLGRSLINVERWGFYFVPPDSDLPIGNVMLKSASKPRKAKTGRVAVRKILLDSSRTPSRGDLGGFTFQITTTAGALVGATFTTNSHGHALSEEIDAGDYLLTELPPQPPRPTMEPAQAQAFTLKSARHVLFVENQLPAGAGPYGQ
jgi:deferrochelatase/peroxidase EfeB